VPFALKLVTVKIRIKGNSIRFRLTRTDVKALAENGSISEFINFGEKKLGYEIRQTSLEQMSVSMTDYTICVAMPATMTQDWVDTDKVGFESVSGTVYLLVEKDFACIDNTLEDQSDNYPNPLIKC
jgi:hypothetical protein